MAVTMGRLEVRLSNLKAFDATAFGNWGCDPVLYPEALGSISDSRFVAARFGYFAPAGVAFAAGFGPGLAPARSLRSAAASERISARSRFISAQPYQCW